MWDYKASFWHQNSKTSPLDDNPLFTIQNLCFHGAKATKISIFWYPQSCQAVMLMLTSHSSYVTPAMSLKLCHSPLLLMPMIPEINDLGRPQGSVPSVQSCWHLGLCDPQKRDFGTSTPKRHNLTITHCLQYKTSGFMLPKPPKYQYFGTPKDAKQ